MPTVHPWCSHIVCQVLEVALVNIELQWSLCFCFFVILRLPHFLGLWFANSKNPLELNYYLKEHLLQGHVGALRI